MDAEQDVNTLSQSHRGSDSGENHTSDSESVGESDNIDDRERRRSKGHKVSIDTETTDEKDTKANCSITGEREQVKSSAKQLKTGKGKGDGKATTAKDRNEIGAAGRGKAKAAAPRVVDSDNDEDEDTDGGPPPQEDKPIFDSFMLGYERGAARVVAEETMKYTGNSGRWPLPGCDSKGHITGRHETHRTLSACPLYNNMTVEECKAQCQERDAQNAEKKKQQQKLEGRRDLQIQIVTDDQKQVKSAVIKERSKKVEMTEDMKEEYLKHREQHEMGRKPLMTGLTSEYDLNLFRQAQAMACEELIQCQSIKVFCEAIVKPVSESLLYKQALQILNKYRAQNRLQAITTLKEKQIECLTKCRGRDMLAILGTGYGKSLLFELVPILCQLIERNPEEPITFILSPLNVILQQQLEVIGSRAILLRAGSISTTQDWPEEDVEQDEDPCLDFDTLKEGNFSFLIGHPEDFLDADVIKVLKKAKWNRRVRLICVDEAHCVVQWGENFRVRFRLIDELRTLFPESRPTMLAVTATATVAMQEDICRLLGMKDAKVVTGHTDRRNIFYKAVRRPPNSGKNMTVEGSYTSVLMPLLKELKVQKDDFPKTVIYTDLKWCGFGNELAVKLLSNGTVTTGGVKEVSQFHAPLLPQMKTAVSSDMVSKDGDIRLLLATPAFGMGIDAPGIMRICHAGIPATLEAYSQETGRAGRGAADELATAVIHFNNDDLGRTVVRPEMKEYCLLQTCRRAFLNKHFAGKKESVVDAHATIMNHDCCDNCQMVCDCEQCASNSDLNHENIDKDGEFNSDTCNILHETLTAFFCSVNQSICTQIDASLLTGLTPTLVSDISSNYHLFMDEDTMQANYHHINADYIRASFEIIQQCQIKIC